MTPRTVPVEFVRAITALGSQHGMDPASLLSRAGISAELLERDRSRITADQVATVVRVLWDLTRDELFGLGPQPIPRGTTRLVGLGLVHTPDLGSAVERLLEFQHVVPGIPQITTTKTDGTARITIDTLALRDPEAVLSTFVVAALHRILGWLIGRRIRLEAVELPQPASRNVEDYQEIFGAPVFFAAEVAAFEFDADLLTSPVVQSEESWLEYAQRAPLDILTQRDYGVALADRTRSVLMRNLTDRGSADDVARALAMSPQTLRRRLALEGTSVSQVRDEILRDAAVTSLVDGEETIEDLSARLGFSEPSAFRRAFRRWTGSPPRAYQHRGFTDSGR